MWILAYIQRLAALPQSVDIAHGQRVKRPRDTDLHRRGCLVVGVHGTFIRSGSRFAVCQEFKMANLMAERLSLRMKKETDPADVMFGRVGMGDLLPQCDLYLKKLSGFHLIGRLDDRRVLLLFPICALNAFVYCTFFLLASQPQ